MHVPELKWNNRYRIALRAMRLTYFESRKITLLRYDQQPSSLRCDPYKVYKLHGSFSLQNNAVKLTLLHL
jgi:hypothetical protein